MNTPKQPEQLKQLDERKKLSLSTNVALLDELKTSSFLDEGLNEWQIDKVKEKVKECRDYFYHTMTNWKKSIPEKLDGEQALTLIKTLNLLKEIGAIYGNDVNKYLTGREYSKHTMDSARDVINNRDKNLQLKEPIDNDDSYYVPHEDAARCCDLLYEYLDAASLEDYYEVFKRRLKRK